MKKTIAYLLLSIVLLIYVINIIGTQSIAVTLNLLDVSTIALVLSIMVLYGLIDCFKWSVLLARIKKIDFFRLVPVYFAGELFNALTPGAKSGGEVLKAHYTSRIFSIPQSKVYATILLDRSIIMFVFFILLLFSSVYTVLFLDVPSIVFEIFRFVVGLAAFLSFVIIIINRKIGKRRHETLFKLLNFVYHFKPLEMIRKRFETYKMFEEFVMEIFLEFSESLKLLAAHRKGVAANVIFSSLIFSLVFIKAKVIFLGLGYDIGIIPIIIVVTLSSAVSYIVFTPGGVGITEIVLISLYVAVGVDPHVAATVALIDRGAYYITSFGIGYIASVYMKVRGCMPYER